MEKNEIEQKEQEEHKIKNEDGQKCTKKTEEISSSINYSQPTDYLSVVFDNDNTFTLGDISSSFSTYAWERPESRRLDIGAEGEGASMATISIPRGPKRPVLSEAIPYEIGLRKQTTDLFVDINKKLKEYEKKLNEIKSLRKEDQETYEKELEELRQDIEKKQKELRKKDKLQDLLNRVNESARKKITKSEEFAGLFEEGKIFQAVIMAIDIRRSTEMMLKARSSEAYAEFITALCRELSQTIKNNFGVIEKFTGDGILSFFPEFYSGTDSILFAMKAADECHKLFQEMYKKAHGCFTTILKNVGLGIGIDYGEAYLAKINDLLNIVGRPVVYACRLSGASAGETLLNRMAREILEDKFGEHCNFDETVIDLKHEGEVFAYKVMVNLRKISIEPPDWEHLMKKYSLNSAK